jgi:hypothetical protein
MGRRLLAEWMSVNSRFFQVPGFRWRNGRAWSEGEAERCDPLHIVVNDALARSIGNLPQSIVLVNANGHCVKADIAGVVDGPSLDLYETRAGPMIFVPCQCATVPQESLIVPAGPGVAEMLRQAVHEVDPSLQPVARDFGLRIHENAAGWRFVTAGLWGTALLTFGLALTGIAAVLTQTLAERGHEIALRCAVGGLARDIWTLLAREAAPALAIGTAAAAACGTAVLWLPTGLSSLAAGTVGVAGAAAALVLWLAWALASRFASERAAADRLPDRLRHV